VLPGNLSFNSRATLPIIEPTANAVGRLLRKVCRAYNILRHNGVPLGKADYVQHMFAYLRK